VDTITAYLNYVRFVVTSLPSVRYWITFNEPMSTSILTGYLASVFPPGFLGDGTRALNAIKNIVAAHAQAFLAIKAINPNAQVGITDQWLACKPTLNSLATTRFIDYHQDFLIRALVQGQVKLTSYQGTVFDERLLSIAEADWTPVLDFFGLQYYKSAYPYYYAPIDFSAPYVGARVDLDLRSPDVNYAHDGLLNDMGWEMFPQGLYDCLMKLKQIAKFNGQEIPILVAENGTAEVRDHNRAAYITAHIEQLQRAQADGAMVIGYLHWSSADNWEWIDGYRPEARFGLFSVDHVPPNNLDKLRRITDGALAFSHVMSGDPVTSLPDGVSRYGRYTVDGTMMDPPTMSPFRTFTGTVALDMFTLLLSTSPPRSLFGMLFYHNIRRWVRLHTIHWDATSRTLQFAHPAFSAPPQVAERFFSCVLDAAGNQGTGEACEVLGTNVTATTLNIVRVPLAGVWQSGTVVLSLSRSEGEWDARAFDITNKGDWTTMRGVAAGLDTAPVTFVGSIAPAALPFNSGKIAGTLIAAGTLEIQSSFPQPDGRTTRTLQRLPDGLPF
jgi:hypothetical protein